MAIQLPVFAASGVIERRTDWLEPGLIECYLDKGSGLYELAGYTNMIAPVPGIWKETAIGSFWVIPAKYVPSQQNVASGGGSGTGGPTGLVSPSEEEESIPTWLWAGIGVLGIMLLTGNKK